MRPLPPHILRRFVTEALQEDLGPGDVTSTAVIPEDLPARGEVRARDLLVVAGIDAAILAFRILDPKAAVLFAARDGAELLQDERVLEIAGRARAILSAERTALNILGRLSGIATHTKRYVEAAGPRRSIIADTRKTTPGMRMLEKYAVAVGGGVNHRFGLWDAILIKDNHVDLAGGVGPAIARARAATAGRLPVEVEVRDLDELRAALDAGAEAVLLDNFEGVDLESGVAEARGRAMIEVSGGVRLDRVAGIAALGVDRISVGALTHSAPAADLSMRITTWKT